MKKLINIRVPLFLAVALILGIFSCYEWYFGNFYFGIAVVLMLVALIVFFAVKRYSARKIAIVMLIFVLLGFGLTRLSLYRMDKREVNLQPVTITGRVCDLNRNTSENNTYYLEQCTLSDGRKLSGRTQLTVYSVKLNTGDIVTVSGDLSSTYPIKSSVESYLIRHKINYELTDVEVLSRQSGALKFDETVRKYIYDVTHDYMIHNGDIMYALLTGDRGAISADINYIFSRAGIMHLLAVSGLHVGFIVAVICFALKRLRLHPLLECGIVVIPLLVYAYICAFTPSVMRAIVMVVCSYIARVCKGRYDMLSAVSFAALVILLIQPFYLFDVGFQLSFLSVYGIATLYAPINRWLNRRKINKFIRRIINAFILSLSCVVATLFTTAINFGEIPVFAVLLNIIVIPIISVVFIIGVFALLPSVFHFLLVVADYALRIVVTLANAVAQLSFATVTIVAVAISTVIVVATLFAVGGYVNINKRGKRILYPICALLLVCSIIFSVVPKSARNQAYVSVGHGAVVATVSQSGEATLVVDFNSYYNIYGAVCYLRKFNLSSCSLYISDCSEVTTPAVELLMHLPIDKVYYLSTYGSEIIEAEFAKVNVSTVYQYPNSTTGNSIKVQSHVGAGLLGVSISVDGMDICIAYGSASNVKELIDSGIVAHLFVLPEANAVSIERNIITVTPYQSNTPYNYGANKYGNFTINRKGDKIQLAFR